MVGEVLVKHKAVGRLNAACSANLTTIGIISDAALAPPQPVFEWSPTRELENNHAPPFLIYLLQTGLQEMLQECIQQLTQRSPLSYRAKHENQASENACQIPSAMA